MTTTSGDVWERVTVTSLRRHDPHQLLTVGARFLAPSQPWFPGSRGLHSSAQGWRRRHGVGDGRMGRLRSAASGCTPHASTWSPGAAPAGAPWPRCWSRRCAAASTSCSCARRTQATRRSSPPRPRPGRSARRPVRCCSSTTARTSRSPPAPTASTSGRTTWRSRRPAPSPARSCWSGCRPTRPRRSTRRTRTTSASGRCTRRPRSRGASPSASTSCATRPSTPSCRGSRSAASTPRPSARSSRRARRGSPSSARSPTPTTPRRAASALRAALPREVAHGRP